MPKKSPQARLREATVKLAESSDTIARAMAAVQTAALAVLGQPQETRYHHIRAPLTALYTAIDGLYDAHSDISLAAELIFNPPEE